jgi:glutathione S-transferase
MDYIAPNDAKNMSGLRIALTAGLPAPWSMAARFMFEIKGIAVTPVPQMGGQANEDLLAWTGHRNAPVVVYNDEPPRTNWADIIELAERLTPEPRLVPEDIDARMSMFGLCNEICGANGLLWNARILMFAPGLQSKNEGARKATEVMANAYGFSEEAAASAGVRIGQILARLTKQLDQQKTNNSPYFLGKKLSALDLIWASFSNSMRPLSEDVNPMDAGMRKVYQHMGDALQPSEILFTHRDFIYQEHISLPLDF